MALVGGGVGFSVRVVLSLYRRSQNRVPPNRHHQKNLRTESDPKILNLKAPLRAGWEPDQSLTKGLPVTGAGAPLFCW